MNADVDLIASAVEVLAAVGAVPGRVLAHQKALTSVEDLQEAVSYSMATCSGLERHFEDKAVFDEIVSAIYKLKHEVSCQFNNAQSAVQYLPTNVKPRHPPYGQRQGIYCRWGFVDLVL